MATISGIFNDPFGQPLTNVVIQLTARTTTSVTFTGTNAAAVTSADGSYSMVVLPGVYAVTAKIKGTPDYLGVIQVYADSPDASLNQYLAAFNPDDVTPLVLAEMQAILLASVAAAKAAVEAADRAASYVLNFLGPYDSATAYKKNDVVYQDGSEYKALSDSLGTPPPDAPWEIYVEKGDVGPANILEIGTVNTLPAGSAATVEIMGNSPNQTLTFGIPQGVSGKDATGEVKSVDSLKPDSVGNISLGAYTSDNPPPQFIPLPGDPGSTVIASLSVTGGSGGVYKHIGETVSGSEINVCCLLQDPSGVTSWAKISPEFKDLSGTWACAGYAPNGFGATLWTRIDNVQLRHMRSASSNAIARNCRYSSANNSTIDCEVQQNDTWCPFTASPNDSTTWGREIYANAVAGYYGEVAACSDPAA